MPAPSPLVVRCFAVVDEGLVDEWPVTLDDAALAALVPSAQGPARAEIHEVAADVAAKLAGRALGPYPEEVVYYLEPATIDERE